MCIICCYLHNIAVMNLYTLYKSLLSQFVCLKMCLSCKVCGMRLLDVDATPCVWPREGNLKMTYLCAALPVFVCHTFQFKTLIRSKPVPWKWKQQHFVVVVVLLTKREWWTCPHCCSLPTCLHLCICQIRSNKLFCSFFFLCCKSLFHSDVQDFR